MSSGNFSLFNDETRLNWFGFTTFQYRPKQAKVFWKDSTPQTLCTTRGLNRCHNGLLFKHRGLYTAWFTGLRTTLAYRLFKDAYTQLLRFNTKTKGVLVAQYRRPNLPFLRLLFDYYFRNLKLNLPPIRVL